MGARNCAVVGCSALEFRTSGYCLRHKDDHPWLDPPVVVPEMALMDADQSNDESGSRPGEDPENLGPLGWIVVIMGFMFPPFIVLMIPILLLRHRPTMEFLSSWVSRNDTEKEPDSARENPDAESRQEVTFPTSAKETGETEIPWWGGLGGEIPEQPEEGGR